MGYTKLFSSLVASSIWREDDKTRLVWITMLALKNEHHVVEASVPGLADLARVSIEDCVKALEKLQAPDKWSRNEEHEGRRVEKCGGGWVILNGEHYRALMSADGRREYMRKYMQDSRAKKKSNPMRVKGPYPFRPKPGPGSAEEERFVKAEQDKPAGEAEP
jgi:hypothetical protein